MNKYLKYFLIFTIFMLLPTFISVVYAEENENIFEYIDIDSQISLKYTVDNTEYPYQYNLYSNRNSDGTPKNIEIYRIGENETETPISLVGGEWINDNNVYRITNTFEKNNSNNTEVRYKVRYKDSTLTIKNSTEEEIEYEKEYTYSTSHNDKNDGIAIGINDTENIVKEFKSPTIKIKKILKKGTPSNTFTFSIMDSSSNPLKENIKINANNFVDGIYTGEIEITDLDLSPNTIYKVAEGALPETYKFESIESEFKYDEIEPDNEQTIVIKTGKMNSTATITVTNASKVDHVKEIKDNKDGTYTLSLDVTGETSNTETTAKANILVVYDISGSMIGQGDSIGGKYYVKAPNDAWNDTYGTYYGIKGTGDAVLDENGKIIAYTKEEEYVVANYIGGKWVLGNSGSAPVYPQENNYLYALSSSYRAPVTEQAINKFLGDLLAFNENSDPENPNVEFSMVLFSTDAKEYRTKGPYETQYHNVGWVSDNTIQAWFCDDGIHYHKDGNQNVYGGSTNWKAALEESINLLARADGDPTYVIFVTDGQPTNLGNHYDDDDSKNTVLASFRSAIDAAYNVENYNTAIHAIGTTDNNNTTLFGIYAFGREADYLDDLIYTANHEKKESEKRSKYTYYTDNYYRASNQDSLQRAIDDIFHKIVTTAGIGSVSIIDGTTSNVTVSSGNITGPDNGLLHVEGNYKYYLSLEVTPTETEGVYTFIKEEVDSNKQLHTYVVTVTDNGDGTFTLSGPSISEPFSVAGTINNKIFKYEWTGANALYDKAPPTASLDSNGAVIWNLASLGTLLDGVTYRVEFDVWPTQTALDYIADIKNNPSIYDDLPEDSPIKKYLIKDEFGNYTLYTNTENARITYEDSRDEEVEIPISYVNPDPVATDAQKISVEKKWINLLSDTKESKVTLNVTRNEEKYGTSVELADTGNPETRWKGDVYISVGSISVQYTKIESEGGEEDTYVPVRARILAPGYDYSFAEDDYHWDLEVDTMHPMMINNRLTMLVKTDDKTVDDIGAANVLVEGNNTYYVIDNKVYKVVTDTSNTFTVTNHRKSNLNLIKEVDGSIPESTTFTFKITVNSPTDSKIYFGVQDYSDLSISEENRPFITDITTSSNVSREEKYVDLSDTNVELISNTPSENDPMKGTLIYKYKGTEYTVQYFNVKGTKYIYDYTNYFVFNNGDVITVNLKPNWNLRFTSLERNTTYQFIELIDSNRFKIDNSEVKVTFKDDNGNMVTKTITKDIENLEDITLTPSIYNRSSDLLTLAGTIYTNNRNFEALYKNISLKNYLTIEKKWVDNNNPNRPTSLTINLSGTVDGQEVNSQDISFTKTTEEAKENIWTYTVEVDRYHNNKEIQYSADEEVVPTGYIMTKGEDDLHIINTLSRRVPGTKTWLDNNNFDNARPETITIILTGKVGNDVVVEPTRLVVTDDNWSTNNIWNYIFENIPMYDVDGNKITYTIDEDLGNLASNYLKIIDNDNFNITNVYKYTHTSIKVNKEWDSNYTGTYPEIVIRLSANPDTYNQPDVTLNVRNATVCPDNEHCWEYTFTNLPMYHFHNDINNTYDIITYTLSEVSIDGAAVTNNIAEIIDKDTHVLLRKWHVSIDGYTITNTVEEMSKVSLIFKKVADVELDDNHNITGYNAKSGAVFRLFIYIGDKETDSKYNDPIDYNNPNSNWILIGEATSIDSESDELKGLVTFNNLYEGEYRLVEIKAPENYILPKGQWRVMISKVNDNLEISFSVVGSTSETPAFITNTNPNDTKFLIPNYEIPDVPTTGGIGIPNYKQNGLLLMFLSILILIINQITQRKKIENI